ncbi:MULTISPECIES: hypothetical protein [Elizabethkingia]|uniref:hypothetical protein n=1 Tax=Elizabethkingia TaxID=308865 RepID=UPI0009990AFF|nr:MULTISPECIES: hypothetical protein [Elizabethkingia]AQX90542.1 hypothetical protein AYC67_16625 [Elizabethkingia anophelis]EHM7980956.1 hypothetical protein [Elizabethkingia anophelis]EHM8032175.1 hypothetical protein [Elizabethkingia anophelis]EHM8033932.1 hypothetical protein [Elizabethkingia anophelis]EHZ9535129.1 hypothetical protein [Elizabethkingia anophelis]
MGKHVYLLCTFLIGISLYSQSFRPGSELTRNVWYNSSNGAYNLIFQDDGNLVMYNSSGAIVWNSETESEGNRAIFQRDGNLVIYNNEENAIFTTATNDQGATSLNIHDDGNLVIYNNRGRALWSSQSGMTSNNEDYDNTETSYASSDLAKGFSFNREEKIYSKNKMYYICFQNDGNLVFYRNGYYPQALWASGTDGRGSGAEFQNNGSLIVYDSYGRIIFNTNTQGKGGERLSIGNGNLVIYNYNNRPIWISNR